MPACFSDHSPILLEIDFAKFKRGLGFWKFNNSLLKDNEYVEMIKNLIKRIVYQYAYQNDPNLYAINESLDLYNQFLSVQTPESLQTLDISINSELFFDTLLMEIRGATIKYSSEKKKKNKAQEQLLLHDIELLENQYQSNINIGGEYINELNEKREALEQIYKHEAEGAYVRSRAKYKLEGEKPSKMFCSLEKYNAVQRFVPQLLVEDENGTEKIINEQSDVENEIRRYYKCLFENKDCAESGSIESFLGNCRDTIPKLSEYQKTKMEGELSLEEISRYLKKCKNNVAPGSSGFTFDFYKFFWRDLKHFIKRAVDFSFEHNRHSVSQRLGIVSIIPKGE